MLIKIPESAVGFYYYILLFLYLKFTTLQKNHPTSVVLFI